MAKPPHPFPARMAPSIVWETLLHTRQGIRVLDPMAGSGTTLAVAKATGHHATGFDIDPLAIIIATALCTNVDELALTEAAASVLELATRNSRRLALRDSYPPDSDEETRTFLRFWFNPANRRQLTVLAQAIRGHRDKSVRTLMWCAFSRLIVTKQAGASLAMDVPHSRPHKVYTKAPISPLTHFTRAIQAVIKGAPFRDRVRRPGTASMSRCDARHLPLKDRTVDMVITSPPYANGIDYLRGHRMSLVWMGYSIKELRNVRHTGIGAEVSAPPGTRPDHVTAALMAMGDTQSLPSRQQGVLARYADDMNCVVAEIKRVLVPRGRAVVVVGNAAIRGVFISNSAAINLLAERNGLAVVSERRRTLDPSRRSLPPPGHAGAGQSLRKRLNEETILEMVA